MSKAEFIAHVAQAGDLTNAEAKRMVELVFGEIENGLKRARKDGKYTIKYVTVVRLHGDAAAEDLEGKRTNISCAQVTSGDLN